MKRLIIFDMDGTIVNTATMIAKTINHVRHHMGLEEMEEKLMLRSLNDPDIDSPSFFYGTKYFTDEQTKLFEDYYHKNCIIGVELYDGIKEFLEEYHTKYTFSIATNAHSDFAKKILSHLEVEYYFKYIIGADMVNKPKPNPEMLDKTIKKFGIEKKMAVLVGDSLKDKRAAVSAGIDCVLVNWGFSEHNEDAIEDIKSLKHHLGIKFATNN